jgi:DNA repair protein RecN (Recombination protein N)
MKNARFKIDIQPKPAFGPDGNDKVEFMISPNLGEPMKPLARIASGGEMSRMMLAVKTVLADADSIGTLIFDEIDAGVSGRTAQQVAEKLNAIARGKQLLCITHLPQIAAMADTHFLIEKTTEGEATTTSVHALSKDEIIGELARLTGGAQITAATRRAAEEMKEQAEGLKVTLR